MQAANDNNPAATPQPRSAEFDAMLVKYMPGLENLAKRLMPKDHENLLGDTIVWALEKHGNFYGDITRERGGGFWKWMSINMLSRAQGMRRKGQLRIVTNDFAMPVTQPNQHYNLELREVVDGLQDREGKVLLRIALGETLQDVGNDIGLSKERIRQIHKVARIQFNKRQSRQHKPEGQGIGIAA